jgi:membrane protein implicated in regulation of membrane protease activity
MSGLSYLVVGFLLSAIAYLAAAPFLGFLAIAIAGGGVSGSHATGIPDSVETIAWVLCWLFLAAAAVALILAFIRPRPDRTQQRAVNQDDKRT